MSKQLKSYRDFTGGLNADAAPDNLLDNELMRADNVDLSERGGVKKRNGEERLNATSYKFPVEQLIEWPRDDGSEILLAIVGTELGYNNLCLVNEIDYSLTVLCSVGTADKVSTYYLRDKLYINDSTKYWVYDGETIEEIFQSDPPTTLTIEAEHNPSTAPTITFASPVPKGQTGAAMVSPGLHQVLITFVDANMSLKKLCSSLQTKPRCGHDCLKINSLLRLTKTAKSSCWEQMFKSFYFTKLPRITGHLRKE